MQEKFFDQLVKSPDYVAMYQDFLVFYPEQELTKATIDKIQHTMQTLKKNLKAFPVVIEPIRGKGYQLCFKVEEMAEYLKPGVLYSKLVVYLSATDTFQRVIFFN